MVQFKDVSKIFPNGLSAVKDVNFFIGEGEFVFLIGPSGSGKTTLIELLIRDLEPSKGKIYLDDYDITKMGRRKVYRLRRQVGVIFQDYKLIDDKTAYENVAFAMEAAGKGKQEIKETVPYVLDVVGLTSRAKAFPVHLSGGEQQRVAIARAIANNPKILIADEPTGNLDPASAWDIVQVLTKINNWGTTVIMSTHGTDIVNTLNKRVIQMEDGIIVRDDSMGQYEFSSEKDQREIEEILKESETTSKNKSSNNTKTSFEVTISNDNAEGVLEADEVEEVKEATSRWAKFLPRLLLRMRNKSKANIDNKDFESEEENITNFENEREEEGNKKEVVTELADEPILDESPEDNFEGENNKEKSHVDDKKVKEEVKNETTVDLEKKLTKYSNIKVDFLNLPGEIIEDLKQCGYDTIGKIVKDGPEKLVEKIDIDSVEVVQIAKSLDKIVSD